MSTVYISQDEVKKILLDDMLFSITGTTDI